MTAVCFAALLVRNTHKTIARSVFFSTAKATQIINLPIPKKTVRLENHLSRKGWNIKNNFIQVPHISIIFHPSTITISQISHHSVPPVHSLPRASSDTGDHPPLWRIHFTPFLGMTWREDMGGNYTWNGSCVSHSKWVCSNNYHPDVDGICVFFKMFPIQ